MGTTPVLGRWAAFNLVGFVGLAVQLIAVAVLVRVLHVHYLLATGIGVELAVLHNFAWHHRWTWRDRPPSSRRELGSRLARFHVLNGLVSFAGSITIAALCTGLLRVDPILANLIAVGACGILNFAASNSMIFRAAPAAALLMLALTPSFADADPPPTTLAAWRAYESTIDSAYRESTSAPSGRYFAHDRASLAPGWRQAVIEGTPSIIKIDTAAIADGKIHHWVGALFVAGVTIDAAIEKVQRAAGRESETYQDVLASNLIERTADGVRVFMKLRRESVITVTYNTEHLVQYNRPTGARALVRSVATRIAELTGVGASRERERAAAEDSGYLWKLNAYWRYEAVAGGLIVECESVSLSRAVPLLIRPVANPIVDRIARESLNRTLTSLRTVLVGAVRASR